MNTGETAVNRIRIEVPQASARPAVRPAAHAQAAGVEEAAEAQASGAPEAPEAPAMAEADGAIEGIETIDPAQVEVEVEKVNLWYGAKQALFDINLTFAKHKVTALIGPSGCGKSTLLRCFNRMNDLVDICRVEGTIRVGGRDIRDTALDVTELRKNVGMVFQKPNPFPKTIYENVAYGPRIQGVRGRENLDEIVERSIRQAALWDEVKDRLNDSALGLSGGQQQRLCIARAVAVEPEVLLMDEPCSALDPISTGRIEDLMIDLKEKYTIIIVTHNMQQAARASDYTAYMLMGEMVEYRETQELFSRPRDKRTEDYITGRFG